MEDSQTLFVDENESKSVSNTDTFGESVFSPKPEQSCSNFEAETKDEKSATSAVTSEFEEQGEKRGASPDFLEQTSKRPKLEISNVPEVGILTESIQETAEETFSVDTRDSEPMEPIDATSGKEGKIVVEGQSDECEKAKEMESKNFNFEEKQQLEICEKNELQCLKEGEIQEDSEFGDKSGEKNETSAVCTENLIHAVSPLLEPKEDASEDDVKNESTEHSDKVPGENVASDEQNGKQEEIENEDRENDDKYEKSQLNENLIQAAVKHQLASCWTATSHKPYVLNPVAKTSPEYYEVSRLFSSTSRNMNLTITEIERIENPYLLALYLNKKEKLLQKNSYVNEENLFHGTHENYVDNICKNNFDWRRSGRSRGHKFGQGVSFAPHAAYAYYYGGSNIMILSKVLVAKTKVGDCNTMIVPEPFDTTTNTPKTVYVKYEDDDFLPRYVIHYLKNVNIDSDDDVILDCYDDF